MWNFKLEVTRTDHFLEEAKRVCEGEAVCEHEAASEPGHMLACLVGKRHEAKSIQCSQFLFQVCCLSVALSIGIVMHACHNCHNSSLSI